MPEWPMLPAEQHVAGGQQVGDHVALENPVGRRQLPLKPLNLQVIPPGTFELSALGWGAVWADHRDDSAESGDYSVGTFQKPSGSFGVGGAGVLLITIE